MTHTVDRRWYKYSLEQYEQYLNLITVVSNRIADKKVTMKLGWASILFSKFCVTSVSLSQLLLGNKISSSGYLTRLA